MANNDAPTAPELDSSAPLNDAPEETSTASDKNETSELPQTVGEAVDLNGPTKPQPSKEEQLLQSAASGMDDEEPSQTKKVKVGPPKKRGGFKKALLILGILLLAGATVYFVLRGDPKETPKTSSASQQSQSTAPSQKSYAPNTIVYAYKENAADPYTVYWRPAEGGERKQAIKLSRDEMVLRTHALGSVVTMSTTGGLYISTDAGKSFEQVFTISGQEQITGVRVADSGKNILYAITSDLKTSKVISVDLQGKNSKTVANIDAAGVLIYGWNDGKKQFFYSKGCVSCDGSPSSYELYNTETNKSTPLSIKTADKNFILNVAISDDFSTVAVVNATPDSDPNVALDGGAAPYTVAQYDVASKKLTTVATIGTAGEKNANGTARYRTVVAGFLAGTKTLYYADDSGVYSTLSGEPEQVVKLDKPVRQVDYASLTEKHIIFGSATQGENDFTYSNFTTKPEATTKIFDGDANTVVIGVTTK